MMNADRPTTLTEDRLLTEKEAAALLGLKPQTLRSWRTNGATYQPTPVRIGRSVRYRYSTILAYLDGLEQVAA